MPSSPLAPALGDSNLAHVLPALHHALSGSTGTVIATCTLYPLSLVIARLQVQRQLRHQHADPAPGAHHDPRPSARPRPHAAPRQTSAASPSPPVGPKLPLQGTQARASQDAQHQGHRPSQPQSEEAKKAEAARRSLTGKTAGEKAEVKQNESPVGNAAPIPLDVSGGLQSQTQATKVAGSAPLSQSPKKSLEKTTGTGKDNSSSTTTRHTSAPNAATEAEYNGILDAFSRIYGDEGGLRALYSGLSQDAAKSFLDSFLFFMFYEWFRGAATSRKKRISGNSKQGLGVLEDLAVGMAAGAVSRAFTTPIANVVTRKQTASMIDGDKESSGSVSASQKSVAQIMREIRAEKGLSGLWGGYSATLLLTLNPALTFFLQDFLKKALLGSDRWDDPGPQLTFLLAASSKAVASAITYPFQIAKTRMQAGVPIASIDSSENDNDNGASRGRQPAASPTATTHVNPDGSIPLSPSETQSAAKKVESKLRALSTMRSLAQRSVFGTIAQIIRTEGVSSLYDGIQGELLKGFFSHGTTMLAKDVVHRLLFKLYLFTVGLLAEWKARRGNSGGGGGKTGGNTVANVQQVLGKLRSRIAALLPAGKAGTSSLEPLPSSATVRLVQTGHHLSPAAASSPTSGGIRTMAARRKANANDDGSVMINLADGTHRVLAEK